MVEFNVRYSVSVGHHDSHHFLLTVGITEVNGKKIYL